MSSPFGINGVVFSGTEKRESPMVLVLGPEKVGKSTLAVTLVDWPRPGNYPLVLAFDPTGPESCAQLGYRIPFIKVKDCPGGDTIDKAENMITNVTTAFERRQPGFPFTSVVVDCASTMAELLFDEDRIANPSKDPRQNYGRMLEQCKRIMWRLWSLRVPIIWLAWERPGYNEETGSGNQKKKLFKLGGAQIPGAFKTVIAGKADQIVILRKRNIGKGVAGADANGFYREIHTQPYDGTDAGGRYALPSPIPAHLGHMLNLMGHGAPPEQPAAPVAAAEAAPAEVRANG